VGGPLAWLDEAGAMVLLGGKAISVSVTPPYPWVTDFVEESWLILRRCLIPLMFATLMLGWGVPGVQGGNLLNVFGSVDRLGAFFVMASVREFGPWVDGMVVAGVAGTAICADLGARKVREELDALAVLGVDPIRSIVVPRFLALGVMTAALNVVSVMCGIFAGWCAAVLTFGESSAGYLATFTSNFTLPDLLGSLIKTALFGFIVAIVCCYKGMNVKGGPEGVGRAVNQAVVIAFVAIWAFNFMFTAVLLAAFPETGNLH
jgi:phospholipid/cholesterol/gamma-HCH transport system permease protein